MAPPDCYKISEYYGRVYAAIMTAEKGGVEMAVEAILMGCDGFIVSKMVSWAVSTVLRMAGWDAKRQALTIALRCEYVKRSSSMTKAWNLTNKCSQCQCIGHNRRNHTSQFDSFLQAKNLMNAAADVGDAIMEEVQEDGWFSWLGEQCKD